MSGEAELRTEEDVRAVMVGLREAWERGDGEAYAASFSEEAQYVNAPGERVHGRKPIADSHQSIFDTVFKNTKLGRNYPSRIRQLTPEVVLVEAEGAVLFPGEREDDVAANGLLTLVLLKQGAAWRIESFQNTPTGRFRKVNFISRYLLSRLRLFRAGWSRGGKHILDEKRRNVAV